MLTLNQVTHRQFPLFAALHCILCRVHFIAGHWAYDFVASALPLALLLYVLGFQWLASGSEKEVYFFQLTLS